MLGQQEGFALLFCLLLVDKSSLGYLVLRAGLVLVMEAISEGRGNLFAGDGLAASCVTILVVSDKGWRASFLEAGLFNGEVNVGDNGGLDHLGCGVDVLGDLFLDKRSKLAISWGLLGDTPFSNDDCTGGGNDH